MLVAGACCFNVSCNSTSCVNGVCACTAGGAAAVELQWHADLTACGGVGPHSCDGPSSTAACMALAACRQAQELQRLLQAVLQYQPLQPAGNVQVV